MNYIAGMDVRKIVIIGPESTGKSVLCQQLADHYHTIWCPEYAREYLLQHGTDYKYEDLLTIAENQLRLEDEYTAKVAEGNAGNAGIAGTPIGTADTDLSSKGEPANSGQLLFIDTDMYVMKVWCEFVFNNCHRYILDQIITRRYDLYLLCNTDLPWVKDELREYPDLENRQRLFKIYRDLLINQDVPWVEISGQYRDRLPQAIAAVDALMKKQ
jgi:nicotinamide riboside kinase